MDRATRSVQAEETEQEQEQGTLSECEDAENERPILGGIGNKVLAFKGTLIEGALGARGTRRELLASESWIGPETWVLCLLVRRWRNGASNWCRRGLSRWRHW